MIIFSLDEKQTEKALAWQRELSKDNANEGAIGGRFTYQITPTGLGLIIKLVDAVTKQELDLTDFDSW